MDKPASPCLSSRIAYGEQVTPERVAMIDQAEQFLLARACAAAGTLSQGRLARMEVPSSNAALAAAKFSQHVAETKVLGFKYVTLDLEGFRSGSMNEVLPIESLGQKL